MNRSSLTFESHFFNSSELIVIIFKNICGRIIISNLILGPLALTEMNPKYFIFKLIMKPLFIYLVEKDSVVKFPFGFCCEIC